MFHFATTTLTHLLTIPLTFTHSRAHDKLIYIANVYYIRQEPYRKNHILNQFVNYVYE
jgi:hypothetical protein